MALAGFHVVYPGGIEICSAGFCGGRKTGELRGKPLKQGENQNQTQNTQSWNRTCTTVVRGKCSHHGAIPTPRGGGVWAYWYWHKYILKPFHRVGNFFLGCWYA